MRTDIDNGPSSNTSQGDRNSQPIQAVERAAEILKLFSPSVSTVSPSAVAEQLGLNRTTAYRYCISLELAGLLERRGDGNAFAPSGVLLQLGALALGRRQIVELAPSAMRELSAGTGMTVVLSLWGSTGPVVTRVEEDNSSSVVVTVRVGTQLPLTAAQAKVFLAFQTDQLHTERLIGTLDGTARANLRSELATVSEKNIAFQSDTGGINAAAAPIFDDQGICAALALVAPNDVLQCDRSLTALHDLQHTAENLSAFLRGQQSDRGH